MSRRGVHVVAVCLALVFCCSTIPQFASAEQSGKDSIHVIRPKRPHQPDDSFTRMFPGLPPFAPATDEIRAKAQKLGEQGGVIDALDILTDPIQSIVNPAVFSPNNPDNPNMTAGVTFFGQFLDHDLTLDLKSPLFDRASPRGTTNFRTAAFDLDSVYGDGPSGSPEFYETGSGDIKFRVEAIPGIGKRLPQRCRPARCAARCEQQRHHQRQPERRKRHHQPVSSGDAAVSQRRDGSVARRP